MDKLFKELSHKDKKYIISLLITAGLMLEFGTNYKKYLKYELQNSTDITFKIIEWLISLTKKDFDKLIGKIDYGV